MLWQKVAETVELKDGDLKVVVADDREILLSRINGRLGAIAHDCPHLGCPLSEGTIDENGKIVCPWHGWRFDPVDGSFPDGPYGVENFPLEVREDGIYVGTV